jgi:hypothetical protein
MVFLLYQLQVSRIGKMNFSGVDRAIKLLFIIAIISVPLALWKIIEILLFLVG